MSRPPSTPAVGSSKSGAHSSRDMPPLPRWSLDSIPYDPRYISKWTPKPFPSERTVVDLGGSTLRVATVRSGKIKHFHTALAPPEARDAPLEWLAAELDNLGVPPFNLCWAFPLSAGARLEPMGKGWTLDPALVGTCLVAELNKRLSTTCAQGVVHDAVASLMVQHVLNPKCRVAVTWGTGYNVALFDGNSLVNTEMGFAGNGGAFGPAIPQQNFDSALLAKQSRTSLDMPLERMVGGAYLGQLYNLATGNYVETHDLWPLVNAQDPVAVYIVNRACMLVAETILAATRVTQTGIVAYTGGVISETCVQTMLKNLLGAQKIILVAQQHGPELGAALL